MTIPIVLDLGFTLALAPFFVFLILILAGACMSRFAAGRVQVRSFPTAASTRFLIVIPAHDESAVIASTVRSCLQLDYERELYEIYVIADNCTDSTAQVAREAGANVVERINPDLRSKGHALEYFFTQTSQGRPDAGYDAAVLIDADTAVQPAMLMEFDTARSLGWEWIQGYYTVSNPDVSWRTRMMTFAFSLANGVWQRGLEGLGLSVGLKGNGMCFAAEALRRFPWRAYGLVEDMEFAQMLRTRGERVRFLPGAVVFGEMVSKGGAGATSQRRRWESGRRSLRSKFVVPILRSHHLGPLRKVLYLLDLWFPPLSNLALGLLGLISLDAIGLYEDGRTGAAMVFACTHAAMMLSLLIYILSPIPLMRLPAAYLGSLMALPYYVGWKLITALGRGPKSWVRTPRES